MSKESFFSAKSELSSTSSPVNDYNPNTDPRFVQGIFPEFLVTPEYIGSPFPTPQIVYRTGELPITTESDEQEVETLLADVIKRVEAYEGKSHIVGGGASYAVSGPSRQDNNEAIFIYGGACSSVGSWSPPEPHNHRGSDASSVSSGGLEMQLVAPGCLPPRDFSWQAIPLRDRSNGGFNVVHIPPEERLRLLEEEAAFAREGFLNRKLVPVPKRKSWWRRLFRVFFRPKPLLIPPIVFTPVETLPVVNPAGGRIEIGVVARPGTNVHEHNMRHGVTDLLYDFEAYQARHRHNRRREVKDLPFGFQTMEEYRRNEDPQETQSFQDLIKQTHKDFKKYMKQAKKEQAAAGGPRGTKNLEKVKKEPEAGPSGGRRKIIPDHIGNPFGPLTGTKDEKAVGHVARPLIPTPPNPMPAVNKPVPPPESQIDMLSASSPGQKRLRKDYMRMKADPIPYIRAEMDDRNVFKWHFIFQGPEKTPYFGGYYRGVIKFPNEFPFKPPKLYLMTPNGRFQSGQSICLSNSAHHSETWNPAWTVGGILQGLLSFMVENKPTLGEVRASTEERKMLAYKSVEYCLRDMDVIRFFPELVTELSDIILARKLQAKEDKEAAKRKKAEEKAAGKERPGTSGFAKKPY